MESSMAVGFVRFAHSFLTFVERPDLEKSPENKKFITEFLPPEQYPGSKNPEFQNELTGLWFVYRYAIVKIRSTMIQQHAVVEELEPADSSQLDLIQQCFTLSILGQLKQMINEMKGFEDRIVALMEEENPLPRVDTIQEMHNRTIVNFKNE